MDLGLNLDLTPNMAPLSLPVLFSASIGKVLMKKSVNCLLNSRQLTNFFLCMYVSYFSTAPPRVTGKYRDPEGPPAHSRARYHRKSQVHSRPRSNSRLLGPVTAFRFHSRRHLRSTLLSDLPTTHYWPLYRQVPAVQTSARYICSHGQISS